MNILAVYPYVPWPLNRGAYHRAFHLLKALARDHRVHLLMLAENSEGIEHGAVFEFCESVRIVPFQHPPWERFFPGRLFNPLPATVAHWKRPEIAHAIRDLLSIQHFDAVHVLDLVLVQYFMNRDFGLPLVVDRTRVDLQYQSIEQRRMRSSLKARLLNLEALIKLWAFERAAAKRCALQVVCGPDDLAFVRRRISQKVPVAVIPNGVDLEYFNPRAESEPRAEQPTVIFCGAMDYNPNVDALRWFFSEMHAELRAQLPDVQVLIVGKDPIPEVRKYEQRPGVTVTGAVEDVRPYYERAWLQIVPLRIGGGTRLKIVESLGIGTPVVSTRIGAQGLDLQHNHDILYAETPAEFVEEISRALRDLQLRSMLARNGLQSIRQRLSWTTLGLDLTRAYAAYVSRPIARTKNIGPVSRPLVSENC